MNEAQPDIETLRAELERLRGYSRSLLSPRTRRAASSTSRNTIYLEPEVIATLLCASAEDFDRVKLAAIIKDAP